MFRFKRDKDKPRLRERLAKRLSRTRESLTEKLSRLALGKKTIDAELLEAIETQLLMADVGVEATQQIIDDLTARVKRKALKDPEALFKALREDMLAILKPVSQPLEIPDHIRPFIILVVGVNGSG
ncbi:MAG: signal recognition particle-docking protein FtsY, partial [Gammaproteobacteria bacterium]